MLTIQENELDNPYAQFERDILYISAKQKNKGIELSSKKYLDSFENFVLEENHPCIGAQTAVNGKTFSIGLFDKMDCWRTPRELGYGLTEYLNHMGKRPSNYLTYIAIFKYDHFENEEEFEISLWKLLSRLNTADSKFNSWSEQVNDDPTKKDFSLSFGGKAFYLVGMHPESSRKARRFSYPAIAFNLHGQFENLRKNNRYDRMKNVIRSNEMEFGGSINPMLSDFGEGLEAPQYSGREVGPEWKCPFLNQGSS